MQRVFRPALPPLAAPPSSHRRKGRRAFATCTETITFALTTTAILPHTSILTSHVVPRSFAKVRTSLARVYDRKAFLA